MAVDRESLLAELEARFRAEMPSLTTVGRRPKHWDNTPPVEQPALFIALGSQNPRYSTALAPPIWTINATVYLYTRRDSNPPMASLATLLTEMEAALEAKASDPVVQWPPMGPGLGSQTNLGGNCVYARIAGDVVTDEGLLDDQQVAVVTVEMQVGA